MTDYTGRLSETCNSTWFLIWLHNYIEKFQLIFFFFFLQFEISANSNKFLSSRFYGDFFLKIFKIGWKKNVAAVKIWVHFDL
jgi:hypothetical protein